MILQRENALGFSAFQCLSQTHGNILRSQVTLAEVHYPGLQRQKVGLHNTLHVNRFRDINIRCQAKKHSNQSMKLLCQNTRGDVWMNQMELIFIPDNFGPHLM